VLIVGAHQVGKSTLAKGLFPETERPSYPTLDDTSALSLARSAAKTFQQGLDDGVIIDEVQPAPELFLANSVSFTLLGLLVDLCWCINVSRWLII